MVTILSFRAPPQGLDRKLASILSLRALTLSIRVSIRTLKLSKWSFGSLADRVLKLSKRVSKRALKLSSYESFRTLKTSNRVLIIYGPKTLQTCYGILFCESWQERVPPLSLDWYQIC